MENIQILKDKLQIPQDVVILTHRNPDGDALGSSLALRSMLVSLGHSVKVILPSDYPYIFSFMDSIDDCLVFDHEKELAIERIDKSSMIFCLDFNGLDRIDKLGPAVDQSKAYKVLVDHHLDPEPFPDFTYSNTSASSTCEQLYLLFEELGLESKITVDIATSLFVGIITDTGCFKYSTNSETYRVASALKLKGVDDYHLNDVIFNSLTQKQLELLGHCLANRMEIIPDLKAGIIYLTKQDYKDFNIIRGDTESIVNYLLMIKGIEVAAFIREQPTIVKLSLRSKGDISVQELARNHFNGGGHKNASGGSAYAKLDDVIKRFKSVLPKYIKLNETHA